jgi:DNA-binding NarL/FixJ family response regulator
MMTPGFHRVLVVSEEPLGGIMTRLLQAEGLTVDVVLSYGRHQTMYAKLAERAHDVVVLTNTTLTPTHILQVIPVIRRLFPWVRIVVLSGWLEGEFLSALERLEVRDAFKLPADLAAAVRRIHTLAHMTRIGQPATFGGARWLSMN